MARGSYTTTRKILREYVRTYKLQHGCIVCGYKHCADALELHHEEASEKLFNIADGVTRILDPMLLLNEMDKCRVLCRNCHAELHAGLGR